MAYEDSFEREAEDERDFDSFEKSYIAGHCKPPWLGHWQWQLMFGYIPFVKEYAEARRIAKEMAEELKTPVSVSRRGGDYCVTPNDYYKCPPGSHGFTYDCKRFDFIRSLVVRDQYPDIVEAARTAMPQHYYGVSRHFCNEIKGRHQRWREQAKEQIES